MSDFKESDLNEIFSKLKLSVKEGIEEIYTEGEPWKASNLGLLNAILDTMVPGLRITFYFDENGNAVDVKLCEHRFEDGPRDLRQSILDISESMADSSTWTDL